ncbi:MAG: hypothetical protein Q4G18_02290 [Myroides sp.]|nr:hypothetical protein [Myroides sp.]
MKKLIVLFFLAMAISSCSNDDSTTKTTVLEGNWLLVHQYGGDLPQGEEPPGDISNQNIRYHFNGNILKIAKNGEPLNDDRIFSTTQENENYVFNSRITESGTQYNYQAYLFFQIKTIPFNSKILV